MIAWLVELVVACVGGWHVGAWLAGWTAAQWLWTTAAWALLSCLRALAADRMGALLVWSWVLVLAAGAAATA